MNSADYTARKQYWDSSYNKTRSGRHTRPNIRQQRSSNYLSRTVLGTVSYIFDMKALGEVTECARLCGSISYKSSFQLRSQAFYF